MIGSVAAEAWPQNGGTRCCGRYIWIDAHLSSIFRRKCRLSLELRLKTCQKWTTIAVFGER